jgi:hypothetical protein
MAADNLFEINILNQHWLGTEPDQYDLCSHGQLALIIGGQVILDGREEYGLSETALALLRTLEQDHSPQNHVAEKLVFHGCGYVLMQGCAIGADWTVEHDGPHVILKDVVRWDTPDEHRATYFEGLTVSISQAQYRQVVYLFAQKVKDFFEGQEKEFFNKEEKLAYEQFWQEFNQLLQSAPDEKSTKL